MTHLLLREVDRERQDIMQRLMALNQREHAILEGAMQTEDGPVDFSQFNDMTRRLLIELWDAPNRMLSHEQLKEYMLSDENANNSTLRKIVERARVELKNNPEFHYEIGSVRGKGYRLIRREV